MNWFRRSIKANVLINQLGIENNKLKSLVQKHENALKSDGSWNKIKQISKKDKNKALSYLKNKILSLYEENIQSDHVSKIRKTPTGGEWYLFRAEGIVNEMELEDILYFLDISKEGFEKLVIELFQNNIENYIENENIDKYRELLIKNKNIEDTQDAWYELIVGNEILKKETFYKIYEKSIEEVEQELMEEANVIQMEKLSEAKNELSQLASGGGWCISQPGGYCEEYIKEGFEFEILRREGKARVAIRKYPYDSDLIEVRGIGNEADNMSAEDIYDVFTQHETDEVVAAIANQSSDISESDFVVHSLNLISQLDKNDFPLIDENQFQESIDTIMSNMLEHLPEDRDELDHFIENLEVYNKEKILNTFYKKINDQINIKHIQESRSFANLLSKIPEDEFSYIQESINNLIDIFPDRAKVLFKNLLNYDDEIAQKLFYKLFNQGTKYSVMDMDIYDFWKYVWYSNDLKYIDPDNQDHKNKILEFADEISKSITDDQSFSIYAINPKFSFSNAHLILSQIDKVLNTKYALKFLDNFAESMAYEVKTKIEYMHSRNELRSPSLEKAMEMAIKYLINNQHIEEEMFNTYVKTYMLNRLKYYGLEGYFNQYDTNANQVSDTSLIDNRENQQQNTTIPN